VQELFRTIEDHALWLPWKTQQIHGPDCFINTDKN